MRWWPTVGATLGFRQSPRSFLTLYGIFTLWRRCFPLDFTGALFCTLLPPHSGFFFCLNFVAFLHVFDYFFDVQHQVVLVAIASLTPLFSWLKGVTQAAASKKNAAKSSKSIWVCARVFVGLLSWSVSLKPKVSSRNREAWYSQNSKQLENSFSHVANSCSKSHQLTNSQLPSLSSEWRRTLTTQIKNITGSSK